MKRTLTLLIIISLIVSFGLLMGCDRKPAEEVAAAPEVTKPGEGMYFRLVTHGGDDPFWAVVQQGMRDAAEELGCRADIDLAGGDLSNQQKKFEEAVASKPDGIAVVINDNTAWDKPVADALAAGITFEMIDAGGLEMTTVESRQTSYLVAHPETTFMFGAGGICTDRLTSSLKNAGKKPGEVLAGGFDAAPGTVEGLKTDFLVASIDQQQYLQGYYAVYTLYLYNKFGLTPNIDTGGYLITKDNLGLIEELSGTYR